MSDTLEIDADAFIRSAIDVCKRDAVMTPISVANVARDLAKAVGGSPPALKEFEDRARKILRDLFGPLPTEEELQAEFDAFVATNPTEAQVLAKIAESDADAEKSFRHAAALEAHMRQRFGDAAVDEEINRQS